MTTQPVSPSIASSYRAQLSRYLCARDCDRVLPLLLKHPSQLTDDDRTVLADAASVIQYAMQSA